MSDVAAKATWADEVQCPYHRLVLLRPKVGRPGVDAAMVRFTGLPFARFGTGKKEAAAPPILPKSWNISIASSLPSLGRWMPNSAASLLASIEGCMFSSPSPTWSHLSSVPSKLGGQWLCFSGEPSLAGDRNDPCLIKNGEKENGLPLGGARVMLLPFPLPVMSASIPVDVAARTSEGRLAERFSGDP